MIAVFDCNRPGRFTGLILGEFSMSIIDYSNRQFVPGVAIYRRNGGTGKYRFLMPMPYAVDCYGGDALVCDSSGNPKPGMECPVPVWASDFGEKFADLDYCVCACSR